MTPVWQIVKKDFHLHRAVVVAWILISLTSVVNRVNAPRLARNPDWQQALPTWLFAIALGYALLWLLGIANVIQSDRLVGNTAFWLTRPISRGQLLGGKLLGLCVFILLPTLAIEAMLMAAFQVSPGTMVAALAQQAWTMAIGMVVIVFLATVTATAFRVVLIIIFALAATVFYFAVIFTLVRHRVATGMPVNVAVPAPAPFTDPSLLLLTGTTFAIGVLMAIAYQYWQRRRGPAVAVFVAAIAVSWMSQGLWAHVSFFGEPTVEREPFARDLRPRLRTVDAATGQPLPASKGLVDLGRRKAIMAPLLLDGLPATYTATPFRTDAELRVADGRTLTTGASDPTERQVLMGPRLERWATLISLNEEQLRQARDQPATYTGTFEFTIERREPLTTMPVAVGASYSDGTRSVTISALRREPAGCDITLTTTSVNLLTHSLTNPELALGYYLRDGRELFDRYAPGRQTVRSPRAAFAYAAPPANLLQTFDLAVREAYPVLPDVPIQWSIVRCEEITMTVERVRYAGRLTRTLTLHDFRLNDPFSAR